MSNFLDALKYYAEKNNIIKNEDIFMLDIGGNLGAYPSFLGKFGYSILTFEASPRNSYIINKNYCHINRYSNIIVINKGLSNEEKTCNYYSQIDGIGNGIVLCNENEKKIKAFRFYFKKTFEIKLTKLSNFLPYLSKKNIALIKLDIEGGEGIVIEDALELISKYHVPFVFSEFSPEFLKRHGTDPKKYLELFINNGYKISYEGFLNVTYVIPEKITKNYYL
jgi:FkbM family methyltransferase